MSGLPSTVDLQTATYSNSTGSVQMLGLWIDPEFNPAQSAIYYARALEIATPRWSTYLSVQNSLPLCLKVVTRSQKNRTRLKLSLKLP